MKLETRRSRDALWRSEDGRRWLEQTACKEGCGWLDSDGDCHGCYAMAAIAAMAHQPYACDVQSDTARCLLNMPVALLQPLPQSDGVNVSMTRSG